ncbi:ABC transporter D family member 1 [Dendrobium catenatum]|uniref:ABC transporter D family member 1 n=1 Tax=Dendrobium catenatum TaxID=906689 RepID=A0A2I0XH50_9ASPA|nr:ABC transporter D family member 1 [Dendrobium catenatum]
MEKTMRDTPHGVQLRHMPQLWCGHGASQINLSVSVRRTLALVAGVMVTGGTAVYMQSRITKSKRDRSKSSINVTGHLSQNGVDDKAAKILRKKRSGLRSLHILTAILLSKIGPTGLRTLVGLVTTADASLQVLRTALSNRLARVQGRSVQWIQLIFWSRIVRADFGSSWDDQSMAQVREQIVREINYRPGRLNFVHIVLDDVAIGRADQLCFIRKSARFEERENHFL